MLAIERRNKILETLQESGIVKVELLARKFNVSEMTIRRDLEKCEKEGRVFRCHGGAVLKEWVEHEDRYTIKSVSALDKKKRIAAFCLKYINPGSAIFLDAGTTTMELAKLILNIENLTVLTNDLAIALFLSSSNIRIIVLGGQVENYVGSIHGYVTERMLDDLCVDIAFVGGAAIDQKFDLFTSMEGKVYFKRKLMQCANRTYILLDSSKFFKQSLYRVNNLREYTKVITDKKPIDTEWKYLKECGIDLICVDDEKEEI